ncbi:hypothetical protein F5880DRAFT_1449726, partial [Lentinula raphanica]
DEDQDGVEVIENDDFDQFFGDGRDFPDIVLPQDSCINDREARYVKNFVDADNSLTYTSCSICEERDWNMDLREGVCKRCRRDKGDVKKWSRENNTNPSRIPPALQGLTDLEEMMISLVLPLMQVRYTNG